MKRDVCSVYDRASQLFGQPIFVPSTGVAIRSFSDEVARKGDDNPIAKHPEDYELFHLGTFDDERGTFEALSDVTGPVRLVRARDLVAAGS